MNFLLLWMQSLVGVTCVTIAKKTGIIRLQPIAVHHAKAWLPISILLVSVIYTGSKSLVSPIMLLALSFYTSENSNFSTYLPTQYSKT